MAGKDIDHLKHQQAKLHHTREAFARGVDCIDLRILCNDDRDFANPIEPSVHGGAKIAAAILSFATPQPARSPRVITR